MKVLHLLATGGTGGIEVLCKDILTKAKFDNRICCLFDEGEIFKSLKEENRSIFSLKKDNRNLKKITNDLVKYCIDEKIDIITIHHGGLSCNLVYIMLKKRLPNLKYVRYLHACFDKYAFGNDKGIFNRILIKKVMQKAFNCSDLLIFISKAVKISFESQFNIKNKKKVIIYNGIDEKFFTQKKIKRHKQDKIINIIFIGRLSYVKVVEILIKALKKVCEKNDNIFLTIVGDGEEKERLISLSKKLNVSDKIKFVGRQSDVIEWLDTADMFVYPSIWEEGFGMSVVEAMARGCIPIVSNKGGLPEVVQDFQNGFLFEKGSVNDLIQKINIVINLNVQEKSKLILNAMNRSKVFSIENTIKSLNKELKDLMSGE